jgi:septal ring factor EnvC (AmiA/AmiB activator)
MRVMLRVRLGARMTRTRRAVMLGAAVVFAGGLAVAVTQVAGAEPRPSVSSVEATINTLNGEFNKANQQYDQVEEQLTAARSQLDQVNKQLARQQKQYEAARKLVVQIAASTYEDSGSTSLAGLLTSDDPSQVLAEA